MYKYLCEQRTDHLVQQTTKYSGIVYFWVENYLFKDCNVNGGGAKLQTENFSY